MATTPNYGWVMPDPTDFVTDLPADFEIFGDAADASVKALNPGTTAGDVDYYTSGTAKARLAIGTAGQVLAVNSGATAPEWVTSSSGALTLLETITFAGAASYTTSTFPSGYQEIHILIDDWLPSADGAEFRLRYNGDTASKYGNMSYNPAMDITSFLTQHRFSNVADNVVTKNHSKIQILNYASTTALKMSRLLTVHIKDDGTGVAGTNNNVVYNDVSAITTATVFFDSGNVTSGTMKVYGYK